MKTTVSRYDFKRAFSDANRKENFSYEGLALLFDYLEEYEESTGEEIELDVIAICCDYCEDTEEGIIETYSIDMEGVEEDERTTVVREFLEYHTTVVGETASGFVFACF
jgi:hypothetical protein